MRTRRVRSFITSLWYLISLLWLGEFFDFTSLARRSRASMWDIWNVSWPKSNACFMALGDHPRRLLCWWRWKLCIWRSIWVHTQAGVRCVGQRNVQLPRLRIVFHFLPDNIFSFFYVNFVFFLFSTQTIDRNNLAFMNESDAAHEYSRAFYDHVCTLLIQAYKAFSASYSLAHYVQLITASERRSSSWTKFSGSISSRCWSLRSLHVLKLEWNLTTRKFAGVYRRIDLKSWEKLLWKWFKSLIFIREYGAHWFGTTISF